MRSPPRASPLRCGRWLCRSRGVDPIHFPGLAAVTGECLLFAGRTGGEIREDEATPDRFAVQLIRAVESTAFVLERAEHRDAERAAAPGREIDAPLARLRVVEP